CGIPGEAELRRLHVPVAEVPPGEGTHALGGIAVAEALEAVGRLAHGARDPGQDPAVLELQRPVEGAPAISDRASVDVAEREAAGVPELREEPLAVLELLRPELEVLSLGRE